MGLKKLFSRHILGRREEELPPYRFNARYLRWNLHLQDLLSRIEAVPGDIVECGVGTGYTLFVMAEITNVSGLRRKIWGFDSFEGLPEPSAEDQAERYPHKIRRGRFRNAREFVYKRMTANGLDERFARDNIVLEKGWFEESLDRYRGDGIALLHIDADMYQSYKVALEKLYSQVVPGGIVALDEYDDDIWVGARKAVDEFFNGSVTIHRSHVFERRCYITKPIDTPRAPRTCAGSGHASADE